MHAERQIESSAETATPGGAARKSGLRNPIAWTSPDTRRLLANIRVIIAIVAATEASTIESPLRMQIMLAVLGYAAYAGTLCWVELSGRARQPSRLIPWLDAIWLLLIVGLAQDATSLFVLLLLFPVLFAAISFNFASGMMLALFAASAVLIEISLHAQLRGTLPGTAELVQPLALLLLGPIIAGLASAELKMNFQKVISGELHAELDPRRGPRNVADTLLRTLSRHFDADLALMLVALPDSPVRLYRYSRDGQLNEPTGTLRDVLIGSLATLPDDAVIAHHLIQLPGLRPLAYHVTQSIDAAKPTPNARSETEELTALLEAGSLIAAPICRRSPHASRLLLMSQQRRYRAHDAELLHAVMEPIAPVIENASLLERLTEEAMATERARIGRDLHDKAIQPYLGIKFGIEALARRAAPNNPLHDDIRALNELIVDELHALRETVSGMRGGASDVNSAIATVLKRQARRFSELFGLDVKVDCDADLHMGRRLTAEIVPIVSEALTNIRRHTAAARADIRLTSDGEHYLLRISNPTDASPEPAKPFRPRSIVERAGLLHGCAIVDTTRAGFTDVMVNIPKQKERVADERRDIDSPDPRFPGR